MSQKFQCLCRATRLAVVAAAIFGATGLAHGQPDPQNTTLYLVLRTGQKEKEKDILKTLQDGLDKSKSTTSSPPSIRLVSSAFFAEFASLVDKAAGSDVVEAKDGMSIRMLPAREAIYELKMLPTQILKKLRVTDLKGTMKEFTPVAPGAKGGALLLTVPGRYAFTPELGTTPASYEADVAELGKEDGMQKGAWPIGDKYFVVTMRDFKGDRKLMFKIIQDPNLVGNPLDNVQLGNDLLFAFAALKASKVQPPSPVSDGFLTVTVPTLKTRRPRRVWVYFPLDEKAMAEAKAKFNAFDRTELSAEIRKTGLTVEKLGGNPVSVGPKDAPRWFELSGDGGTPEVPSQFVRRIKLDGMAQLIETYPRVWMLQVWEFDLGKPEAISVNDPNDPKENDVLALEAELQGWARGLTEDIARKSPPTPPKKP